MQNPASRRFHEFRPSGLGVRSNIRQTALGNQRVQPLPPPTGQAPYHLALDHILPADQMAAIQTSGRMLFHIAGDTGGVKAPQSQQIVDMAMEQQFAFSEVSLRPAFFYHLGDVVYYYGEGKEYYPQFYEPYVHYPAPIFAIPGNHDGDITDGGEPSLVPFVRNFCASVPQISPDAGETARDSMTQPNVYWTLETPFATFIGLYSNVPEGGHIDDSQFAWFVNELRTAPTNKALIVCAHHPAYSADTHHSGSKYMEDIYDSAFSQARRLPDVIFAGHVHNYQRFTRVVNGRHLPYIVAGAGGYWNLHYLAKQADGTGIQTPYQMPDADLMLEGACDDRHGFMRMMVTPQQITGEYWSCPRPQESWRAPAQRVDGFILDLQQHKITKGTAVR
jgi:acid phosphatase type 7